MFEPLVLQRCDESQSFLECCSFRARCKSQSARLMWLFSVDVRARWWRISLPRVRPSAVESEASRKATAKRSFTKGVSYRLDDERSWPRHGQRLIVLKLTSRLSGSVHLCDTEAELAAPIHALDLAYDSRTSRHCSTRMPAHACDSSRFLRPNAQTHHGAEPRPLSREKPGLLRIHALPSRCFRCFPLAFAFLAPEPAPSHHAA